MSSAEAAATAPPAAAPAGSAPSSSSSSSSSLSSARSPAPSAAPSPAPTALSTPPSLPLVRLTLDASALVCDTAVVQGVVTVGAGSIVHPRARLLAVSPSSSVSIGSQCVVCEDAVIEAPHCGQRVTVGNWSVVECRAVVRGSVGHASWLRCGCEVTENGVVGRGCEVGVGVRVDGKLEDGSILLLGDGGERRLEGGQHQLRDREKRIMEMTQLLSTEDRLRLSKHHKMIR